MVIRLITLIALVGAISLGSTGCRHEGDHSDAAAAEYMGRSVSAIEAKFGAPVYSQRSSDGTMIMHFIHANRQSNPKGGTAIGGWAFTVSDGKVIGANPVYVTEYLGPVIRGKQRLVATLISVTRTARPGDLPLLVHAEPNERYFTHMDADSCIAKIERIQVVHGVKGYDCIIEFDEENAQRLASCLPRQAAKTFALVINDEPIAIVPSDESVEDGKLHVRTSSTERIQTALRKLGIAVPDR